MSRAFSVSDTKQVMFSKGNLQYQASTNTWRFAENRYDMIGEGNLKTSKANSDWIDLFGWGTSGYDGKYPYTASIKVPDYYDYHLFRTNYDWGVYNAISNGGNEKGLWRTLTAEEWQYLLVTRENAAEKYANATVNDVHGLILLPDICEIPRNLPFNHTAKDWKANIYSASDWLKMQDAGVVFFPAAGWRVNGTYINDVGEYGIYWSSSHHFANYSLCMFFAMKTIKANPEFDKRCGHSVRLVRDL